MRARIKASLLLALTSLACAQEQKAPPATTVATGPAGLKPLTSRDGSPRAEPGPTQSLPPGHPPIGSGAGATEKGEAVAGTLTIAPSLASRAMASRALYIVARSAATQQIVAVRKEDAPRFPFAFRISGADEMTAGTTFAGPFDLVARLSKSGDAIPASGDIEGQAKGVQAGASGVAIVLDTVRQ